MPTKPKEEIRKRNQVKCATPMPDGSFELSYVASYEDQTQAVADMHERNARAEAMGLVARYEVHVEDA